MSRLLDWLPWAAAYRLADLLGDTFFWLIPKYRRIALWNLGQAFGQVCPEPERRRLARRSFRNLMRTLVELFKLGDMSFERWRARVPVDGQHYVHEAMQSGQGCITVSAHLGNWEWLAARAAVEYPISVVVRDQGDMVMDTWLRELRQSEGGRMIPRKDVAAMLRVLQRGEMLAMLVDQNTRRGPVFVPFFGSLAATAPGAIILAQRKDVPVIPAFIHRNRGGHRVVCYPPLRLQRTGDARHDLWRNTARMTRVIEKVIEQHPDEWLWIHQRWKTRPGEQV